MPQPRQSQNSYRAKVQPWYGSLRWKHKRAWQLAAEPLCCMCLKIGRTEPATVADHIKPHRGDATLFWEGPLQSLCAEHHNSDKQRIERGGKPKPYIGADGWPI